MNKTANLSLGGITVISELKHSSSIPYGYDARVCVIPRGISYSSLEKLFFPYKTTVWMCIGATFLVITTVIVVLKIISKKL